MLDQRDNGPVGIHGECVAILAALKVDTECGKYGWALNNGAMFCTATQGVGTLDWRGNEFACDQADTHVLSQPFREVTFCASYKSHCLGSCGSRLSWLWGEGVPSRVARGAPNSAAAARDDLAPAYPTLSM